MKERAFTSFETYFGVKPYENWYEVRVYPYEDGISVYFQITTEHKRAEEELKKHRGHIEELVEERTAELAKANKQIQREITERVRAEEERERLIGELQEALDNIKALEGLIPICANCKKIRDDEGFWQDVEVYVRDHSEAEFSHGICPGCAK